MRILIADDYDGQAQLISYMLSFYGYRAQTCDESKEAVERCLNDEFDLVFMDIRFNGQEMDGIEATKAIKAKKPNLPIIGVSTMGRTLGDEHPFDELHAKPLRDEDFLRIVEQYKI